VIACSEWHVSDNKLLSISTKFNYDCEYNSYVNFIGKLLDTEMDEMFST